MCTFLSPPVHLLTSNSKSQLEHKLQLWGFRKKLAKNTADEVWELVNHLFEKREKRGKASELVMKGKVIPPATIKKERSRRRPSTLKRLIRSMSCISNFFIPALTNLVQHQQVHRLPKGRKYPSTRRRQCACGFLGRKVYPGCSSRPALQNVRHLWDIAVHHIY